MASLSIAEALELAEDQFRIIEANPHKTWIKNATTETVMDYLWRTYNNETRHALELIDGILLMYCVGKPWWAEKEIVQEDLLLRVGISTEGGMTDVAEFLEQTARILGAHGVAFGSSLSVRDAATLRLYRQLGYTEQATLMYKEIE